MFSNLLSTLRNTLSRSPSYQDQPSAPTESPSPPPPPPHSDAAMVGSTRRGPVAERTPQSVGSRRKRTLEAEETPVPSLKKRRRASQEKADVEVPPGDVKEKIAGGTIEPPLLDNINVTPATQTSPSHEPSVDASPSKESGKRRAQKKNALPIRRGTNPKAVVQAESGSPSEPSVSALEAQNDHDTLPSTQESDLHTPATTLKEDAATPTSKSRQRGVRRSTRKSAGASNEIPDEIPSSTWESGQDISTQEPVMKEDPVPAVLEESDSLSELKHEAPSSTFDDQQAVLSTQESAKRPTATPAAEADHIRFDSEEPAEQSSMLHAFQPIVNKQGNRRFIANPAPEPEPVPQAEPEDASDSDDAPEMVTKEAAATKAQAVETGAARAFKAHQDKLAQRRKERAEQVAKEQAEKRRKEEKKAKKMAKLQARQAPPQEQDDAHELDLDNLPSELPTSLLANIGDQRPLTPPPQTLPGRSIEQDRKAKLNKHIKFLERGNKPVKDVKKGGVNVHVLANENLLLPPKVNRDARGIREHWLKGRQQEKKDKAGRKRYQHTKVQRKAAPGGFLRDRDE